MKLLKLLLGLFEQDPEIKAIKTTLNKIDKKIANTKNYDELLELCREYKLVEQKLKEYKIKKNNLPNH